MERKGVLPRRQSLLPLPPVVGSHVCGDPASDIPHTKSDQAFKRSSTMSGVSTLWRYCIHFSLLLRWVFVDFIFLMYEFVLPSPTSSNNICQNWDKSPTTLLIYQSQISPESDESWDCQSSKSGHLISIILCYHRAEKGLENRAGPCMTFWFPRLQTVHRWWKETLSQWSQSFSHPSISSSSHSQGRRCRWQPNSAMSGDSTFDNSLATFLPAVNPRLSTKGGH